MKWVLLITVLFLTSSAQSQSYNFRNFTSEDGLPQSYIYSITQDDKGYLWIGTGNGLSKYNGFSFVNYTTSDSLADNFITCSINNGEQLWFGHMNGRITNYDGNKFQPVSVRQPDLSRITSFAKGPDGSIWAGTYSDGLLKLDNDTGAVKYNFINENVLIVSFSFLNDNDLLVGTNTGLLYCRIKKPGVLELIRPVLEIPESKITCIRKMRNKSGFYVATENDGIFQLTNEQSLFLVSKITMDQNIDFSGIQDILEDSQSDLWVGSFGTGLTKLSHSASGLFTKNNDLNIANGFTTDNVKSIFEDREGTIWSGNYGQGLTLITPKTFFVTTFDKVKYGNDIFSILFTPGNKWIGTEKGLIKTDLITGKIIKFYGNGKGFPKDTVTSVYSPDGKVIWIGTNNNGLFRLDNGKEAIHKYQLAEGSLENSVTVITGRGDQIWVGTKKGLNNINSSSGSITRYNINQGLPHNYINDLYLDRTGKLWVTTRSNILSFIEGEKVFKIPLNSITRVSTLGPVTEDSDSIIWVGSNGNGVFMINSDSVVNLTVKEGLLSNYCYSIICDDQNNVWVGHKGGLSKIRTSDFSIKPVQHIENTTDSYQFNPNSIIKDRNGKIMFGSDKGLVTYDPSMEPQLFLPPLLGITSIKINDEVFDFTGRIVLSPGSYKIRIDFIGVSLKEPTLVTYQYSMEGYDHLSEITRNTSVTYGNLKEGEYLFILNSSSGDGAVSENPLILNILIKKSIWKNWWFYAIQVLLLMILIFLYLKRREYRFLAEKKILEEKVVERTYEIQLQKNEIELQRDVIDEKNISITSSIRYASHIQNAVLPPMELFDKLLPENFLLSKPKDIVSGDFYWLAEKNGKIVFTVADCTGHGVPGAFMGLLGITLLNEIVNTDGNTRSDIIVTKLRERVIHSLQQGRKDIPTSDGMDIALCVFDPLQNLVQYSGGMSNLVYVRDSKVEVVKADRFSVCIADDNPGPFKMNEINTKAGDVFYLFSDGYKDQFGGDFDKKYLVPHFYLTLLEIHKLPMSKQKEILEKKLNEWMKDTIQTDDITVMGIRL